MEHAIIPPCFYRISVKALIHNNEGKFLLVKEENGLWELPGGGVDYGENLQECLKREIREEMGLETLYIADEPSYFFTSTNLKGRNIANALYNKGGKLGFFTIGRMYRNMIFYPGGSKESRYISEYSGIPQTL